MTTSRSIFTQSALAVLFLALGWLFGYMAALPRAWFQLDYTLLWLHSLLFAIVVIPFLVLMFIRREVSAHLAKWFRVALCVLGALLVVLALFTLIVDGNVPLFSITSQHSRAFFISYLMDPNPLTGPVVDLIGLMPFMAQICLILAVVGVSNSDEKVAN